MLKLTRNEKTVLKSLITNGRVSDSEIAKQLRITAQAVGKIRRKLEKIGYIKGYTAIVDYDMLGIKVFAVALFKYSHEYIGKLGDDDIKERIQGPHIINFYRVPEGDVTHIVVYGFRSLDELDNYFHVLQTERGHISEIRKLFIFSSKSRMKSSPQELFIKIIDELDKETLARPIKPKPIPR